jgi:hypothetical protein
MWDVNASHLPKDPLAYSGGERGSVGGLTSVQKLFIYQTWREEVLRKDTDKKEKESSILNNALLNSALLSKDTLLRKVLDHTRG